MRLPRRLTFCLCALVACATCAVAEFSPVREVEVDGRRILIDNTKTRLSIEVIDEFEDQPGAVKLARGLYRDYAAAAEAADAIAAQVLPSVSLVYAKGKRFDDGMYAAVELALEDAFGALTMGKPEFLQTIFFFGMAPTSSGSSFVASRSCMTGAPLTEASSMEKTGFNTLYLTFIFSAAFFAISSEVAATAATLSPINRILAFITCWS